MCRRWKSVGLKPLASHILIRIDPVNVMFWKCLSTVDPVRRQFYSYCILYDGELHKMMQQEADEPRCRLYENDDLNDYMYCKETESDFVEILAPEHIV